MVWLMLAVVVAGLLAAWWFAISPFLVGPALVAALLLLALVTDRLDRARQRSPMSNAGKVDWNHGQRSDGSGESAHLAWLSHPHGDGGHADESHWRIDGKQD